MSSFAALANTPVLLLAGGTSPEHEVSLASAAHVRTALAKLCPYFGVIYITKAGLWQVEGASDESALATTSAAPREVILRFAHTLIGRRVLPAEILILSVIHGGEGEDGCLQGWFEIEGFRYLGAGVLASALSMDKATTKRLCHHSGIPTLPWLELSRRTMQDGAQRQEVLAHLQELSPLPAVARPRWIVKPNSLGSSLGVTAAATLVELEEAISYGFEWDSRVVVEPYLHTKLEIECAVFGHDEYWSISEPGEVWSSGDIYSYEAKYHQSAAHIRVSQSLTPAEGQTLKHHARTLAAVCRLAGMARMDWLYCQSLQQLYLSEINTAPGLGPQSHYIKLWELSGKDLQTLLRDLLCTQVPPRIAP